MKLHILMICFFKTKLNPLTTCMSIMACYWKSETMIQLVRVRLKSNQLQENS